MLILPLRFIREEDKKTVGSNIYHLAKLSHLGLPVVESVVAIPPIDEIQKSLHILMRPHVNITDHLEKVKSEVLKLPLPDSLKNLEIYDTSEIAKFTLNFKALWQNLLEKWTAEIISKIERGEKNILQLTPQLVIFSANFTAVGSAFFDEDKSHAVINTSQGKLTFAASQAIENIVIVGNKKLLLPQIYHWAIVENKIKIIKVAPFTQAIYEKTLPEETLSQPARTPARSDRKLPKTATKIFANYTGGSSAEYFADGTIFNIRSLDIDIVNQQIESILKLGNSDKFIFNLDLPNTSINNLEYAKLFTFFKNKKKLDVQIVLPQTYSLDQYLQLKRDFASLGVYSKGQLKLWKQFNALADFMNLDSYLEAGFDGALIDLDKISEMVIGLKPEEVISNIKSDWISALEKFFKQIGLSKILKSGRQVLIKGKLLQSEELLNYFVKSGVWGLASDSSLTDSLKEHVSYLEKLHVKKLAV